MQALTNNNNIISFIYREIVSEKLQRILIFFFSNIF